MVSTEKRIKNRFLHNYVAATPLRMTFVGDSRYRREQWWNCNTSLTCSGGLTVR